MKVSYYQATITPDLPVWLDGYGPRQGTTVEFPLLLEGLCIETSAPIIYLVLDVIAIEEGFFKHLRKRVEPLGIRPEGLIISASHTHQGPAVLPGMTPHTSIDPSYLFFLEKEIMKAVADLLKNLQPAYLESGQVMLENIFNNRNEPSAYYYPFADLYKFYGTEGQSICHLVNFACHPTATAKQSCALSSDLLGPMRELYQEQSAPLLFFNGEAGDVSTRHYRKSDNPEEVTRLGHSLAKQLLAIRCRKVLDLEEESIKQSRFQAVYHSQADQWLQEELRTWQEKVKETSSENPHLPIYQMILGRLEARNQRNGLLLSPTCTVIEYNHLRIITFPGELVGALAKDLRQIDAKPTLLFCYSNGYYYYGINEEQYGKYYESYLSYFPKGMADEIIAEVVELCQGNATS